jgi:hypothetical protein
MSPCFPSPALKKGKEKEENRKNRKSQRATGREREKTKARVRYQGSLWVHGCHLESTAEHTESTTQDTRGTCWSVSSSSWALSSQRFTPICDPKLKLWEVLELRHEAKRVQGWAAEGIKGSLFSLILWNIWRFISAYKLQNVYKVKPKILYHKNKNKTTDIVFAKIKVIN